MADGTMVAIRVREMVLEGKKCGVVIVFNSYVVFSTNLRRKSQVDLILRLHRSYLALKSFFNCYRTRSKYLYIL